MQTLTAESTAKIRKHFNQQINKIQMGIHSIKRQAQQRKKDTTSFSILFFSFFVCIWGVGGLSFAFAHSFNHILIISDHQSNLF
jgi:hypothetical protein